MALKEAYMDSLLGAGAEILQTGVRRPISKGKWVQEWLDIMHEAQNREYNHISHHDVRACGNHTGTF